MSVNPGSFNKKWLKSLETMTKKELIKLMYQENYQYNHAESSAEDQACKESMVIIDEVIERRFKKIDWKTYKKKKEKFNEQKK